MIKKGQKYQCSMKQCEIKGLLKLFQEGIMGMQKNGFAQCQGSNIKFRG